MGKIRAAIAAAVFPAIYVAARVIDVCGKPKGHLLDSLGDPYMYRWHIVRRGTRLGKLLQFFTGYGEVRLHAIHHEDHDRDLHNHPTDYLTVILRGGYVEEVRIDWYGYAAYKHVYWRQPGDIVSAAKARFHRIARLLDGPSYSMFFLKSGNEGDWGFYVDGEYVPRKEYFAQRRYYGTWPAGKGHR